MRALLSEELEYVGGGSPIIGMLFCGFAGCIFATFGMIPSSHITGFAIGGFVAGFLIESLEI